MGILLAGILILILLGSFASIFIGLIAPKLFKPLFKRDLGRGKTSLIFLGIAITSFIIIGVFGNKLTASSSNNPSENKVTATPDSLARQQEDVLAKQAADVQATTYKTKIAPLIQQFKDETAIIDKQGNASVYGSNASFVQAVIIYGKLGDQIQQLYSNKEVPSLYTDYNAFFATLTGTMKNAMDDIVNPKAREGYNQISPCADEAFILAKQDFEETHLENLKPFKIADPIFPDAIYTYDDLIRVLGTVSINMAKNPILFQNNSCTEINHF